MIRHIFVIDASGLPVYSGCIGHVCALGNLDELAVSSLLSALNSFSKQIGVGGLQSIVLEEAKFVIKNAEQFFITIDILPNENEQKYNGFLEKLTAFVKDNYPNPELVGFETVRVKLVTEIERFLAESGILGKKISTFQRIKRFFKKVFGIDKDDKTHIHNE